MEEMNTTMNEVMMENEVTEMVSSEPESIYSEDTPIETDNSVGGLIVVAGAAIIAATIAAGKYAWNHREGIKNKLFGKKNKKETDPEDVVAEGEAVEVETEETKE